MEWSTHIERSNKLPVTKGECQDSCAAATPKVDALRILISALS